MKRTLFFIKDELSGKFYNGSKYIYCFEAFENASIYVSEKNAQKQAGKIIAKWIWSENCLPVWKKEKRCIGVDKLVKERKALFRFGVKVVSIEVNAPK